MSWTTGVRKRTHMAYNPGKGLRSGAVLPILTILFLVGCAGPAIPYREIREARKKALARMGYTVQVGAFARAENASRLTDVLRGQGVDATYFLAEKGLFKVRFGNFTTRNAALKRAQSLQATDVIADYYIVSPGQYAAARVGANPAALREELVKTARSFIGVPYLWGGDGLNDGFDCSGLTMTVYQLNGLDLPRTSQEQSNAGSPVTRDRLLEGDLIFFHAAKGRNISHVALYIGGDRFIHAPGRGKKICTDSLERPYFRKRFVKGSSYL